MFLLWPSAEVQMDGLCIVLSERSRHLRLEYHTLFVLFAVKVKYLLP